MCKSILTLLLLALTIDVNAQVDALFRLIDKGANSIEKKRKAKLAKQYLFYYQLDTINVVSLRVPSEKIKSEAKDLISLLQNKLENLKMQFMKMEQVQFFLDDFENDLSTIKNNDPAWVIEYYEDEIKKLNTYQTLLDRKERKRKKELKAKQDSIDNIKRKEADLERFRIVFEEREKKKKEDSIALAEVKKQSHFVNFAGLDFLETPNAKSRLIGKIAAGSYVTVLEKSNNGYAKIKMNDYEGYVLQKHLVDNLDKITVPNVDIEQKKKSVYTSISFAPIQDSSTPSPTKSSNTQRKKNGNCPDGVILYTGKRGGCYYLSGSRKVYVDRNCCN